MLVLTRKSSEEILFPTLGISIRVVRIGRNKVKLGIDAPPSFRVCRGEHLDLGVLMDVLRQIAVDSLPHDMRGRLNAAVLEIEYVQSARARNVELDEAQAIRRVLDLLDGIDSQFGQVVMPAEPQSSSPRPAQLLVVDDNVHERTLLTSVLSIKGFGVEEACDGDDALKKLGGPSLPDAVLLDLKMPRLDGERVLRSIRCDSRLTRIPVFGISGYAPVGDLLPENTRGFDAWFDKPLDVDRLVQLIHEVEQLPNLGRV